MNQLSTFFFPTMGQNWILLASLCIVSSATSQVATAMVQEEKRYEANEYLNNLDVNRNEVLEPEEINGRARRFLRNLEFDTDRPIPIKRILRKLGKSDDDDSDKQNQTAANRSSRVTKVPGFGPTDSNRPVPTFGLSDVAPATARFSESVLEQVEETLARYDRNKDEILDSSEMDRARWGNPEPSQSDTNNDGKLSRIELANRYFAREKFSQQAGDSKNARNKSETTPSASRQAPYQPNPSSRSSSGSRVRTNRSARSSSRKTNATASDVNAEVRRKYASYAQSLIKNYDKDGDGNLSQEEVKSMRRPPVGADGDGNGYITEAELVDSLSGGAVAKAADVQTAIANSTTNSQNNRNSAASKSGARTRTVRARGSFNGLDANEDNQVEMHEYADDWNDQKVSEFFEKDTNGDGVITLREWNSK